MKKIKQSKFKINLKRFSQVIRTNSCEIYYKNINLHYYMFNIFYSTNNK